MSKEKIFVDVWNSYPRFCRCLWLNARRARELRERAKDAEWVKHWREALKKAHTLAFCCGQSESGWRATVDWFLKPETVCRILEGHYDFGGKYKEPPKVSVRVPEPPPSLEEMRLVRRILDEAKVNGWQMPPTLNGVAAQPKEMKR